MSGRRPFRPRQTTSDRAPGPSASVRLPQSLTGRGLAFAALREFEAEGKFVAPTMDRLDDGRLAPSDRGLATELGNGILRRRATLDAVLKHVCDRPRESVESDLWLLMRLGAYQLLLMPGLPPHAAIHETVELARAVGMPRWTGFLNGILRSISRLLTPDEAAEPSARGLPQVRLQMTADDTQVEVRYVTLKHAVFPDPAADPREYLAEAFSMPVGLTDRWSAPAGSADALRLAAWFATPGVLSLRINATRTTREAFLDQLRQAGFEALPGGFAEAVRLRESARVTSLPGFHEGAFSVQDESAMAITDLLDPQPGESILDLCAAPGGKSTHCAERMRNSGSVAACDLGAARLHAIQQSAERLGLAIIETHSIRDDGTGVPEGPFDAAIVDAPCSNTGVLGKRPEARWRLSAADFAELPGIQSTLLARGADRVRPGGRIVYSTCSIDPAENDDVVRQFLAATPGFSLAKERRSIPGRPGDGGYAALLIKG